MHRYFGRITGELNIRADRLGRRMLQGRLPCALLPVIAAIVAYAGTFGHDFAFDDVHLIPDNDLVCGDLNVGEIFASNYWEGTDIGGIEGDGGVGSAYRPVTIFSHAVVCSAFGPEAFVPHAVNLALHVLNALLVFVLLSRLTAFGTEDSHRPAAAVATLFAVHPLNSEVVFLAVGRSDLLATGALLIVVILATSRNALRWAVPVAAFSFTVTLFGMMSKESMAVAPVMAVFAYQYLQSDRRGPSHQGEGVGRLRFFSSIVLPSAAAIALYIVIRTQVLGAAYDATKYSFLDNPLFVSDYSVRLFTGIAVLGMYAWRFVSPTDLSADYSFAQVPRVQDMGDSGFLIGAAVLLALLAGGIVAMRRAPLVALGVAWFLIAWAPVSNIPFPIGTIMGERLCYLSCIGWIIALVAVWRLWRENASVKGGDTVVAVFLIVVLGGITVARGHDFADNCTLFEATVRSSPDSAKAHYGHGICLLGDDEKQGEAVAAFHRALNLYPDYEEAVIQLAQVLEHTGYPEDGLLRLKAFVASHSAALDAAFSLAKMLARHGRPEEAGRILEDLARRRPDNARVREALSNL